MAEVMIDIDEVICPTLDTAHKLAEERGYHDGTEPVRIYQAWEQYGIEEQVYWDLWADLALGGHYLSMKPIPGTAEAMRRLHFEGHNIHIATARGFLAHAEDIRAWTDEWIHENAIPHKTLSYASDKVALQQDLGLKFDYALDDRIPTVQKLRFDGVAAFVQNHTHNAADEVPSQWRVDTMDQFVDIILAEQNEVAIEESAARAL